MTYRRLDFKLTATYKSLLLPWMCMYVFTAKSCHFGVSTIYLSKDTEDRCIGRRIYHWSLRYQHKAEHSKREITETTLERYFQTWRIKGRHWNALTSSYRPFKHTETPSTCECTIRVINERMKPHKIFYIFHVALRERTYLHREQHINSRQPRAFSFGYWLSLTGISYKYRIHLVIGDGSREEVRKTVCPLRTLLTDTHRGCLQPACFNFQPFSLSFSPYDEV
jgi:hypothetical protein